LLGIVAFKLQYQQVKEVAAKVRSTVTPLLNRERFYERAVKKKVSREPPE